MSRRPQRDSTQHDDQWREDMRDDINEAAIINAGDKAGVARPESHMLAHYDNLPIAQGRRPVCTWPLDTVEGRTKLHQCTQGGSFVLWDRIKASPLQIEVVHLASSFSEWEDEKTGEVKSGPMLYLIGSTGIIFHSSSELVYRSLVELALLEGLPPWEPPIIMQAERVPTRKENIRIALTYISRGRLKDGGVV